MDNIFIKLDNVSFSYSDEFTILDNINLCINSGEFVTVLGKSGSGKSTFAKLLNALLVPSSGNVIINGMDTRDANLLWEIRRLVGMVFQNPENQIIGNTVEEDIAFGPENLGVNPIDIKNRVEDVLQNVGMVAFKKQAPHLLSGGQKQKIAIASVLAMQPSCIILDEATSMLDPNSREEILHILKKINTDKRITIIHITHEVEEVLFADRVIIIDEGKIALDDKPTEVFGQVEFVKKLGIELPAIVELFHELKSQGIPVERNILDVFEAAKYLSNIIDIRVR